ncbi:iron chelate uptake ABC transporter family permease subunit [Microbacterium sp. Leaf179]|uniref:iron chelate uptake ABC transporter family permease subunit n=1 Tax=Microbacterium sp. Leaf179 TaxID=1736288 RepID=UPI0006F7754F|nr:iron chelate uptake ABC transporter family permease subunit [Microbacterium sp. Leaf179]KQR87009.1 enterobactin ABC transporter permease [Microbacterium sp. Leaf179]
MAEILTRPAPARAARRRRIGLRFGILAFIVIVAAVGVLTWNVPGVPGSRGFWIAVNLRVVSVATIALVACCQAVATVLFHTATANRILTPSIMGFDALYVVMQTALVFFFGSAALSATDGLLKVVVQSVLMVGFATLLYGWLFAGRRGNLHIMLLVGVVLGVGFGSLSTVMQRLLTPSDFDILSARLFGNLSNSDAEYLPWGALVVAVVLALVWRARHRLDVLALGRDTSLNLGLAYRREVIGMLVLVAVLISVSTTMVGPMTFFGFIVATLAYQLAGSSQHRVVLPFAVLLGTAALLGGYFVLRHVFYAAGMLSIIIEFVGGVFFLVYLLRKGSL